MVERLQGNLLAVGLPCIDSEILPRRNRAFSLSARLLECVAFQTHPFQAQVPPGWFLLSPPAALRSCFDWRIDAGGNARLFQFLYVPLLEVKFCAACAVWSNEHHPLECHSTTTGHVSISAWQRLRDSVHVLDLKGQKSISFCSGWHASTPPNRARPGPGQPRLSFSSRPGAPALAQALGMVSSTMFKAGPGWRGTPSQPIRHQGTAPAWIGQPAGGFDDAKGRFRQRSACRRPSVRPSHAPGMFTVFEADAAAIRAAYEQDGELSAAIELRRWFPGFTDNARARECARTIAGWTPMPATPPVSPRAARAGRTRGHSFVRA